MWILTITLFSKTLKYNTAKHLHKKNLNTKNIKYDIYIWWLHIYI